eukprot:TRINITY_DN13860_c0_g1_i1.p1 TRINITY_DN13860_c0_g1~~TRINITY_DN13860_c0_g1_i1.p1  ORF type:complete len:107 (-),score=34.26 TRINITY_DN13860_c0_g1_i1:11-331(-)
MLSASNVPGGLILPVNKPKTIQESSGSKLGLDKLAELKREEKEMEAAQGKTAGSKKRKDSKKDRWSEMFKEDELIEDESMFSFNPKEIGRAVQQECRDRSRMPSSA